MRLSSERILTSHVGSLPRPQDLLDLLEAKETGESTDDDAVDLRIEVAIGHIVKQQIDAGIDIINDGENSKTSYTLYVRDRLLGVGPKPPEKQLPKTAQHRDLMDHPGMVERTALINQGMSWFDRAKPPAAIAKVSYFGSARHNQYQDLDEAAFLKIAERNVEALNHATRNIEPERMRMHVCWGNYEGPHTHDIPFASLHPVIMKARPAGLLIEGANPAHAHEWEDMKRLGLPDDKILLPGVIDTTTNFVENPRLVAQRIEQWANAVGRERVIASTDCGFATFAGPNNPVIESIVWAKLNSLSQGAAIASDRLW